jgi:hypothetical protein
VSDDLKKVLEACDRIDRQIASQLDVSVVTLATRELVRRVEEGRPMLGQRRNDGVLFMYSQRCIPLDTHRGLLIDLEELPKWNP